MFIRNILDISIPDNLIDTEEYKLIRADHTYNIKRGGIAFTIKDRSLLEL